MSAPHKRFFWILVACFGATLLPIFILNLILLNNTLGNYQKVLLASQWQQRTRGITYALTTIDTHLFKTLRLDDRLPEINTVVFGSSTAYSLTQQAFPDALRIYNYAQSNHSHIAAIGEATWLMAHTDNIKYLIIPLDWLPPWIYDTHEPVPANLSAATTMQQIQSETKPNFLLDKMCDALSYPRIASLLEISKAILRAENRSAAFRGYFLQEGSDDYRCADGTLAKDFDIIHRGTCTGFRFDGSYTFGSREPVKDAQPLILSATAANSEFNNTLMHGQGQPSPVMLRHLVALARQAERKGGKLLLFMPPLLPGIEAAIFKHAVGAPHLTRIKQTLNAWAERENIIILDAGQSEHFGCNAVEFVDDHHTLPACYDKVFAAFWNTHTRTDGNDITWPSGGLY